jgi:CAAX protease family protein
MNRADDKYLWVFLSWTYAIMLLALGSMIVFHLPGGSTTPGAPPPPPVALLLLLLSGFSPSIVGVLLTWKTEGGAGLRGLWSRATRFALGWKAYLVIVLLPVLALGLRAAVYLGRGGVLGESALLTSPAALLVFVIQIILLGPVSEEFGWRGFALDRLLAKWSPLTASLVLGALWALWHLLLFFVPDTAQFNWGNAWAEFPLFALTVIAGNLIYTWLYLSTGRSVWSALLFHFTMNFCVSFWVTLARDGLPERLASAGVFIVAAIIFAIGWDRRRPSSV